MNQEILYRYLKGDTTPQEDLQVAEWLEADPVANQKELDIVRFVFEGMELYGNDARSRSAPDARNSHSVAQGVDLCHACGRRAAARLCGRVCRPPAYVRSLSDRLTAVHVPNGQRIEITLPDDSASG